MVNDLATGGDGWGNVPSSSTGLLKGSKISFNNGDYFADKNPQPLRPDLELLVVGVATCWQKWQGGRPVDVRETLAGQRHPDRDELGDLDPAGWEPGLNGELSDCWRDTRFLYMVDPRTAKLGTFTTTSAGGRWAVGDLKNAIINMRYANPGAVPLVRLASTAFKTRFGMKRRPHFEIVDWRVSAANPQPLQQLPAPTTTADDGFADRIRVTTDMNDEIPF
jgi:hypothetical protein